MRTETTTRTLFQFNELSEDAQERAIQRFRDINTDHEWYDSTVESLAEELENIGFNDPQISFSGFWSQGDGASFTSKRANVESLIEALKDSPHHRKYKRFLTKIADYLSVTVERINHRYSHQYSARAVVDSCLPGRRVHLDALINRFEDDVESLRLELSNTIYETLEKEYEFLTSDQIVIETIEANEYEFLECGTLA